MKPRRGLPPLPKRVALNGKRPCRGCGAEIPKARQAWCSNECRDRHYMALSSYVRPKLYRRDKGVCAKCGCDTDFLHRMHWVLRKHPDGLECFRVLLRAWGIDAPSWCGWHVPAMWEADHVIPLVEGGPNTLDNYRTLCVPCHKEATRELAARRATARRLMQEIPL